ncbi:MAG: hypothetical protein IIC01_11455 [Planctomycetes bacterium]|nr:hypothetical protein [Planctomycetota bacterium]
MSKKMPCSIATLRTASARLNKLTDEAAITIRQVEDFLNKECSLGVATYVAVSKHQVCDDGPLTTRYLAYCRIGQRYRIAVVWVCEDEPDASIEKPWSDCTRDDKIETLEKLPDLIAAISSELESKIGLAEKSLATASEVANALVGKAG